MEPNLYQESRSTSQARQGWVEVVCGPMFSGKTEELLRRLRRAKVAGIPLAIFKPEVDSRYSTARIVSHDANYFPSMMVARPQAIIQHAQNAELVAIDEVQFFDLDIVPVIQQLALSGKRVIVAGLDMDFQAEPFGPMPQILAISEYITKLNAICTNCGRPAAFSFRKAPEANLVMLGSMEEYEPRCRSCFYEVQGQ